MAYMVDMDGNVQSTNLHTKINTTMYSINIGFTNDIFTPEYKGLANNLSYRRDKLEELG